MSAVGRGAEAAVPGCSGIVDDSVAVGTPSLASASDKNDDGAGAHGVSGENTELKERESSAAKIDFECRVDESFGSLGLNWKSDDETGGVGVGTDKGGVASLLHLFGNAAIFLRGPFVTVARAVNVEDGIVEGADTAVDEAALTRQGSRNATSE